MMFASGRARTASDAPSAGPLADLTIAPALRRQAQTACDSREGNVASRKVIHAGSYANRPGLDAVAYHRGGRAKQFGLNTRVDLDGSRDIAA